MNKKNKSYLQKNFFNLNEKIDFNFLSNIIDRNNFSTQISSNFVNMYILDSVFKILNVEKDEYFFKLFNFFNSKFNKKNYLSDFHIFFSLKLGNRSITHKDDYDVYILGLNGTTLYKIEEKEYYLNVGDLLYIPKNSLHTAIGITSRIILSYGLFEIKK